MAERIKFTYLEHERLKEPFKKHQGTEEDPIIIRDFNYPDEEIRINRNKLHLVFINCTFMSVAVRESKNIRFENSTIQLLYIQGSKNIHVENTIADDLRLMGVRNCKFTRVQLKTIRIDDIWDNFFLNCNLTPEQAEIVQRQDNSYKNCLLAIIITTIVIVYQSVLIINIEDYIGIIDPILYTYNPLILMGLVILLAVEIPFFMTRVIIKIKKNIVRQN
jgi:hypothetical protein